VTVEERENVVVGLWLEALTQAYQLAKGERLGELRGRRAKSFDGSGMHPYSHAWGRVQAFEQLVPWLAELRVDHDGEVQAHEITLRQWAQADAEQSFADELREHGTEVFAS
jgi:hypothetical protein